MTVEDPKTRADSTILATKLSGFYITLPSINRHHTIFVIIMTQSVRVLYNENIPATIITIPYDFMKYKPGNNYIYFTIPFNNYLSKRPNQLYS